MLFFTGGCQIPVNDGIYQDAGTPGFDIRSPKGNKFTATICFRAWIFVYLIPCNQCCRT